MSTKVKKRIIKDKVELEKIIDYYLRNDLSLAMLETHYALDYPQREFLLTKSMGYSRQQDILMEEYNTTDVAATYLEIPHDMKEEDALPAEEQIRLFKRLDEIDTEQVRKRLYETNDELSKVLTALRRINDKYNSEVRLFNQYRQEYPHESLRDILTRNGLKPLKIEKLCLMYEDYLELMAKKKKMTAERDELLKKRRTLLDTNYEYANIIETLTTTNVKLANWVIREFFKNIPLPKDEAQALALEGLGKAINRFDYTRGNNFSTFATKMMTTNIMRRFKDMMGVSWVNYWMRHNINYWREELESYDKDRTTPITPQELADSGLVKYTASEIAGVYKMVNVIYNFSDYYDLPQEEADEMPVTQEDYDFIDALEDMMETPADQEEAEREFYLPFLRETLYEVLGELNEREQKVLSLRFGLEDGQERTLEEVGKIFFLSRDRIRQIEAKALRRLRHPSRARRLLPYIEDIMMPHYYKPSPTNEECVEAFMRLYEFRKTSFSYKAKAFFISSRNLEVDEKEARNMDMIIDVFITNISLGYECSCNLRDIVDAIDEYFGSSYRYKYPYERIYKTLENKIKEEELLIFSEDEKKELAKDAEGILKLVLSINC